jgi:hypothetical protein
MQKSSPSNERQWIYTKTGRQISATYMTLLWVGIAFILLSMFIFVSQIIFNYNGQFRFRFLFTFFTGKLRTSGFYLRVWFISATIAFIIGLIILIVVLCLTVCYQSCCNGGGSGASKSLKNLTSKNGVLANRNSKRWRNIPHAERKKIKSHMVSRESA